MNQSDNHGTVVPDILRKATDQLDVPTVGLAAIRRHGGARQQRRRAAVATTCAVLLVGGAVLTVQRLSATSDRTAVPGTAGTDPTTPSSTSAAPVPVGQPVERVDSAFVWNLVTPGSAEAVSGLFFGPLGAGVTDGAPYLAWSTSPGPTTDGLYQPVMYRSDDGIHWTPAAASNFTEPQVTRRGLAAQGDTLFAFGTAAATAAIPNGGAGDAVVDVSTDGGATWAHQVLPIDLRGLAAADGVGSVGLSGGMASANGVVAIVAQPSVQWDEYKNGDLIITPEGVYKITYPTTCDSQRAESSGCVVVATTTVGLVAIPAETAPADTTPATDGPATANDDTSPTISDLIPLSDYGIDPATVVAARTPRAFFSTDGNTFTEATFPALPSDVLPNGDMSVLTAGGQFYATLSVNWFDPSQGWGDGQLIYRSRDGATWEQVGDRTSFKGRNLLGVLPDGTMVAGSYNPGGFSDIATSVDGVTWLVHDLTPLIEPSDGEIVVMDPGAITVNGGGITAIGYVRNDPIAEAGGQSMERDGVRVEVQSSILNILRAYDSATGDEISQQNLRYTNVGDVEVLADDGSVRATFTSSEWQGLMNSTDGQRLTRVLLHSDDGFQWSRENLADLTGSADAGPGFFQFHDGKVLITLVDPSQRIDTMAVTMVLVGTRK
ncbi:hypothetical protein BH10ACT2_BH10ACT2_10890 [soil metagenome]